MIFYLLLVIFPLISHLLLKKLRKNETYNLPPGPKGLPLIGNLHQLDSEALYVHLAKLAKTYGPIMSLRFGLRRIIVVQSAEIAKEVLKTQDVNFCSRAPYVGLLKFSYNGIGIALAPFNECYKQLRKLSIIHLLSPKRVQESSVIRQEELSRLMNKIFILSSKNQIVNLSDLLMSYSCSSTCRMAFGKSYEDDGTKSKLHELLHETQALFAAFYFADYFPGGSWLDKISGTSSKLENIFKRLDEFYEEIINDHLHPNNPNSRQEDFIDIMLRLRRENSLPFEFTLDHIKALIMDVFVAGTDTSAIILVWAMTALIKNPEAMKRAQDELRTETRPNGYTVDDDLSKFEYFMGVVKETFRMHPPAPIPIPRETNQKCSIMGYDILPKTVVFVNVWAIGRDPNSWKDPEKFMPERFIGSTLNYKGQDFEFLPFGGGRRICPGMHLGTTNMMVTLANLLYRFNWEMPVGMNRQDIDTQAVPGIAMHKKNPLCLVATKFVPS